MSPILSKPKLEIAIVGGGVCGLTCAVALAKNGIQAQVYESAGHFGEIGAGIGLGPNCMSIMKELGIFDDIVAHCPEGKLNITGFRYVLGAEGHEFVATYPTEPHEHGAAIHRAVFLDELVKRINSTQAHLNKRCIAITPSSNTGRSVLQFTDGTSVEADVVLVANGIKSTLRETVTGLSWKKNTAFSNTVCYRGLVLKKDAAAKGVDTSFWDTPNMCTGYNKHIVIYPINKGAVLNLACFVCDTTNRSEDDPTSEPSTTAELLSAFEDFGSNIRSVLGCVEKPVKWYINIVWPHLPTFVKGRVALLGDAAHGMLPHLYAGAGQGVEDSYLLAQLLSKPQTNTDNVEAILQVYDEIRRPRSQKVLELSTLSGVILDGHGKSGFTVKGLKQDLLGQQDYIWSYRVGVDVRQAERMLRERGVFAEGEPDSIEET